MTRYVFDTNIVSLLVRRDPHVISQFRSKITHNDFLIGCPVVWYEAKRGLLAKDAKSQVKRFNNLCTSFQWDDFTLADWNLASERWVQRRQAGKPITDSDLLIAVFAYNRGALLVTDHQKDFHELAVTTENWKSS